VITTFAGIEWLFPGDGRRAIDAPLAGILGMGVAADNRGSFYIADADNLMVMKVGPDGMVDSGDGGLALNAAAVLPTGVAVDLNGNVYIAEYGNRIRKVAPDGIITTVAGTGDSGFSGDGGPATSATFRRPYSIALDKAGTIYVADRDNHRIRKISGGIVTTIAGTGRQGFSGDDGPATAATLDTLHQLIVQKGNSTTLPEPMTAASAGPAIFTKDGAGHGQGMIFTVSAGGTKTLADPSAPARAGDSIVIECTGLGAVDRPAPAGTAAPDAPAAQTMNRATVTIGGVRAEITFASLEPGATGLYQIKATVPAGAPPGDLAPVQVTVAGQTSPVVTMAIR